MNALTGISLWIALVTVVPGLVTISTVFGAFKISLPGVLAGYATSPEQISVWVWSALVVTIMVLTQALGILLEGLLVRHKKLGQTFIVDHGLPSERTYPVYQEYESLYMLLARLGPDEDSQGHLQRSIAQFFLTNNTMVSFFVGMIATLILALSSKGEGMTVEVILYVVALLFCLVLSYKVAVIRFGVMAKSIWAAKHVGGHDSNAPVPTDETIASTDAN